MLKHELSEFAAQWWKSTFWPCEFSIPGFVIPAPAWL